jgi:hypothetical protein
MAAKKNQTYITHYFFIFLLIAGTALLLVTFLDGLNGRLFPGLRQIAIGIMFIGVGEWINHPLQRSVTYMDRKENIFQKIRHRKRSPSVFGNLFEICGLLLIFAGVAEYI